MLNRTMVAAHYIETSSSNESVGARSKLSNFGCCAPMLASKPVVLTVRKESTRLSSPVVRHSRLYAKDGEGGFMYLNFIRGYVHGFTLGVLSIAFTQLNQELHLR